MNNQELELKIQEIINTPNYFDAVEMAMDFEKDYKTSDFYKKTKKSLKEVIREAKIFYTLDIKKLGNKVQDFISNLDISNLNNLLDQIGSTFGQENQEITKQIESFEDLKNIIGK